MAHLIEKYKSPKLTQKEKENKSKSITTQETEAVIPKAPPIPKRHQA